MKLISTIFLAGIFGLLCYNTGKYHDCRPPSSLTMEESIAIHAEAYDQGYSHGYNDGETDMKLFFDEEIITDVAVVDDENPFN